MPAEIATAGKPIKYAWAACEVFLLPLDKYIAIKLKYIIIGIKVI